MAVDDRMPTKVWEFGRVWCWGISLKSSRGVVTKAQLRVGIDEAVPRDSKKHALNMFPEMGFREEVAFGIEVDEGVGQKWAGREYACFEEVGVDGLAFWKVFSVGVVEELSEEVAGFGS
ncbi:unnamed protein product [Fraxinus pennsylvanica]|uniref:Uncharacterized protein n=1 Tax=Fraxinus pennsylvanica TaxID=56036 RepID=A0AAD1YVU6_9LAMI|nr:unnamed protein product [Fraxinus pennsylvanica]